MHDNHSKTSDPAVGSTRLLGSASPILNIMASPCPGPIFNSVNAAVDAPPIPLHPFLVCGLLCCLMLCECAGDQMAAAGQQQSEYRHARGLNASTAKHAEHNTTKSDKHPSPCNSSFQRLKAWLGKKAPPWLTLPVMTLALFSVCYHTAKAIVDRMTRGLKPNAKVSDGSQPPLMLDLSLSESAGSRSLHRLVGRLVGDVAMLNSLPRCI